MTPDAFSEVRLSVDEGVGLVELACPQRRNAWSGRMAVEYRWALHHCEADPGVRVVVVTGSGTDFCVGADFANLGEIRARGGAYQPERVEAAPFPEGTPEDLRRNHAYPLTLSVPVIAAINGGCAGAGFVVATYADLRFAAAEARIATAFAGLGLPAEYGIGWVLPRQVGAANALQLLFDPAPIPAARAQELGWVQRIAQDGDVVGQAVAYARDLAHRAAPDSLKWMKRSVLVDADGGYSEAYRRSVAEMNDALRGPDFSAAVLARRERRRHDFLGPPEGSGGR